MQSVTRRCTAALLQTASGAWSMMVDTNRYICVSSAYSCGCNPKDSTTRTKSAVYRLQQKKYRPEDRPCSTLVAPNKTDKGVEVDSLEWTYCQFAF